VPPQDRVRRHQGPDLSEQLAAEDFAFDGQASALVVVEQDPPLSKLLPEDLVLSTQIFDDLLLLPISPPGDDKEKELPRLEDDVHGWPDAIRSKSNSIGRSSAAVNRLSATAPHTRKSVVRTHLRLGR
jgi:hypothetical protein